MKKLVVLLITVAMLCAVGMTAFAADVATPLDKDSALKIAVAESFTKNDTITGGYIGTPDGSIAAEKIGDYASLDGGKFTVTTATTAAAWIGVLDSGIAGANAKAEGFGFYVKNKTGAEASFVIAITANEKGSLNETSYTVGSNKDYALVAKDGTKTVVTAPEKEHPYSPGTMVHSYFTVPAGFEGYICVPIVNLQVIWGSDFMSTSTAITGFGWMSENTTIGEDKTLAFDNLFFYGTEMEAKDADLVLNDDAEDTADLSVIAYAVAALTGCGALAIRKKRV